MPAFEKYARLLRDHSLKATHPRIKILETLDAARSPLTVSAIHQRLTHFQIDASNKRAIDLATVYRSANKLADAGLLSRLELGDEFTRFEFVQAGNRHHHHIICTGCGKVSEIAVCNLDALLDTICRTTGYSNIDHEVIFRGQCAACAAKLSTPV